MTDDSTDQGTSLKRHSQRGDALSRVMWASFLLLVGMVLLANNAGILPTFHQAEPVHWIMMGSGVLLLLNSFIRTVSPDYHTTGKRYWFLGIILLMVGISSVFGASEKVIWPIALILLGLGLLARSIRSRY